MSSALDDNLAEITLRDYVCAACWGHLVRKPAPERMWFIECAKDPEHNGFVTKFWVEKQRQADAGNLMDARYLLQKIGVVPNPHAGKTAAQLLKELGC